MVKKIHVRPIQLYITQKYIYVAGVFISTFKVN